MSSDERTKGVRGTFEMNVLANDRLCAGHYLLRLGAAAFPPTRPGQFVQLQCRSTSPHAPPRPVDWPEGAWPRLTGPELAGAEPLLRRPFSLAGRHGADDGAQIEIIYSVVGAGTRWLATVGLDDTLSVLGPLGNAFDVREDKPLAVLVGGGVGIPPLIYLASALHDAAKPSVALCGARSGEMLPLTPVQGAKISKSGWPTSCLAEFARSGIESAVATDDGSLGYPGFVTDLLEQTVDGVDHAADLLVVYACGPEAMMQKAGEICIARGIECQLSLERHMACGMGTCQSCICKVRSDSGEGWEYKLCCADGPVFDAGEIVWE